MRFQLTNIRRKYPEIRYQKVHDFSITGLEKKRKLNMVQPIETAVIRAQQNFEVVGGLNLIQIEIEDNRILNILKNIKALYIK